MGSNISFRFCSIEAQADVIIRESRGGPISGGGGGGDGYVLMQRRRLIRVHFMIAIRNPNWNSNWSHQLEQQQIRERNTLASNGDRIVWANNGLR